MRMIVFSKSALAALSCTIQKQARKMAKIEFEMG